MTDTAAFERFLVVPDECSFLQGGDGNAVNNLNTSSALWRHFDQPEFIDEKYLRVAVTHEIRGVQHIFISAILNIDLDNLKIRIEFIRESYVFYNLSDPQEYYFQL